LVVSGSNTNDILGYAVLNNDNLLFAAATGSYEYQDVVFAFTCSSPSQCSLSLVFYDVNSTTNSSYGESIAINGGSVAVGTPGFNNSAGAVYLFSCNTQLQCSYQSNLTVSNPSANDSFGTYIFMQDNLALISAPGYNNGTGASFLYSCSDLTNCTLQSILLPPSNTNNATNATSATNATNITNSANTTNTTNTSMYGYRLGIYNGIAVVSNPGNGTVYIYNCQQPTNCSLIANITASNTTSSSNSTLFGQAVYIWDYICYIGAPGLNNSEGEVFIYDCSNLTSCSYVATLTLSDPNGQSGGNFGSMLVAYNNLLLVGAQGGSGAVYQFDCSTLSSCSLANTLTSTSGSVGNLFGFEATISDGSVSISVLDFFDNNDLGVVYVTPVIVTSPPVVNLTGSS